jgi:cytochrome c peroxidase
MESDRGAFKTPTLREITRTAPYMHDGSLVTLDDVIDYYDRGGNANPVLDPELRPLRLTPVEKQALRAFLQSLNGRV